MNPIDKLEETRQALYRLTNKCMVNQRAVDEDKITPQQRDEMNMMLFDGFLLNQATALIEVGRAEGYSKGYNDASKMCEKLLHPLP